MTNDELIKHRLKELEDFATGARQVERDVDSLKLSTSAIERTLTVIQTELRDNNERTTASMARLHQRLDVAMTEQEREKGREEGRASTRSAIVKTLAIAIPATIALMGVTIALLGLVLN